MQKKFPIQISYLNSAQADRPSDYPFWYMPNRAEKQRLDALAPNPSSGKVAAFSHFSPSPMPHNPPDALLLIAPGCTHCPAVLEGLGLLLKAGKLGRLEVVNIAVHPQAAQRVGTRSVPWCRIGPFELEGAQSPAELEHWTQQAAEGTGLGAYYSHLLETQRPHKVSETIQQYPASLSELLAMLVETQTPMAVRIGIGVVMEDLQNSPLLRQCLPQLERLARDEAANIRADAAHFLGLSGAPEARQPLRQLLSDPHPDVREIAAESLELLNGDQ
jgi:hypothetical protein